ncbi:rhodanese-like domain-containing protein [Acinetobacter baumannii]|uniref:rhodanese-like domain-containing protein n=1 Tax=Acinetobacter baumannii TaxID=470 RepID=UPI002243E1E3|nr:rhodanese-like domain-containing protein [Acinetobacter baumannii]MCW8533710.1 rhodanese-like domain-containing protein [Acinetobacter baumannii]MCW8537539.1 rhodanese-like domain-containing protein [Acinetobacter baumannii]MCW8544210.1 rhodanese-like domain-containing protein [Acinetobacter baumannii]MCW8547978.1 rhodanese-like domain-containing protein [Acinetobacter baumannii]MCW8558877.1 rhodanese-like domain-containing protein [Acinetobacter baumannii]
MNAKLNTDTPQSFISNGSNTSFSAEDILAKAQQYAQEHELNFSGSLSPVDAWQLVQQGEAVLVDVRTNEERKFVGYVPESIHVAWTTGTSFNRNPRFLKELESKVGKDKTILLLCRSGNRSAQAAEAAFNAGFERIYNVLEGFEGDLNEQQQRNQKNGWRIHQLPWQQD